MNEEWRVDDQNVMAMIDALDQLTRAVEDLDATIGRELSRIGTEIHMIGSQ